MKQTTSATASRKKNTWYGKSCWGSLRLQIPWITSIKRRAHRNSPAEADQMVSDKQTWHYNTLSLVLTLSQFIECAKKV